MIVRMWHGKVPNQKAAAYREFLTRRAIPDYRAVKGNINVFILERPEVDVTGFVTLTFWEDMDSIREFAGNDPQIAKYYPEDKDFLLEFEAEVVHYEVVAKAERRS